MVSKLWAAGLAGLVLMSSGVLAQERVPRGAGLRVAPDLAREWTLQLSPGSGVVVGYRRPHLPAPARLPAAAAPARLAHAPAAPGRAFIVRERAAPGLAREAAFGSRAPKPAKLEQMIDPVYLPQVVEYQTKHKPGTIVVDTRNRFLYLVEGGGKATRYGVGVGREGFGWSGTHKISRKREWPDWRPPAQMIAREKKKGRHLPAHMKGGPDNPLGARALYLGSTLYRIHGTNQPWSIGQAVSSGCIRMRNEDVIQLYDRVKVGAKVVVL